jgi:inosine-uridine nucleoside N-ribohydrolase
MKHPSPLTSQRTIIIDCDPGLDDIVALALAAASPELAIAAITTVAGNAPIERVTDNALSACATLGVKSPVFAGSDRPLRLKPGYATEVWGGDGGLGLKRPRRGAVSESAFDYLVRTLAQAADHSVLMCLLGPLTNLAHLLLKEPALAAKIDRLMIMGGALGKGNATASAEFNIWFDPHAARQAFASRIPMVVATLDLTRSVVMGKAHRRRLARANKPAANLTSRMLSLADDTGHSGALHDATVIACLIWPDLFSMDHGQFTVETEEGPARGQIHFRAGDGNHILLTAVDVDRLLDLMTGRLLGKTEKTK